MEEFKEYYNNVSCTIDRDDLFELILNTAWKMNQQEVKKAEVVQME